MTKGEIDLLAHFQQYDCHGNGMIIKGRVRSGKTYLVSVIARILLDNGFAVLGNVRFSDEAEAQYENLHYVTNDFEYFQKYCEIPEDMPIVLIWDDAQTDDSMTSTGVMTKAGKKLQSFLVFIGKLETNYIYIAHRSYIPRAILEGFDPLFIWKEYRKSFMVGDVSVYLDQKDIFRHCVEVDIPPPEVARPIPILSGAVADWEFVLDLKALWKWLKRKQVGEDLKPAVAEFLSLQDGDALDPERVRLERLRKMTFTDIAIALKMKRPDIKGTDKLNTIINPNVLYPAWKKLNDYDNK